MFPSHSQTYHVWQNNRSGDFIVRTTSYSLPQNLHEHIEVIQPTTMFAQFKGLKSTIHWSDADQTTTNLKDGPAIVDATTGTVVDASCNTEITLNCLRQIYNAVNYTPSAHVGNSVGITGYLEQFANIQDLQSFYAEQLPDAVNTSYKFVSVKGIAIFLEYQ